MYLKDLHSVDIWFHYDRAFSVNYPGESIHTFDRYFIYVRLENFLNFYRFFFIMKKFRHLY